MASPAVSRAPRINQVTGAIVTAAMKVHSQLGPGLLETAYEVYDGERIELGYRID